MNNSKITTLIMVAAIAVISFVAMPQPAKAVADTLFTFPGLCSKLCDPPVRGTYSYIIDDDGELRTVFKGDDGKTGVNTHGWKTFSIQNNEEETDEPLILLEDLFAISEIIYSESTNQLVVTTNMPITLYVIDILTGEVILGDIVVEESYTFSASGLILGCRYMALANQYIPEYGYAAACSIKFCR
ncbi:MAG: hypothetical protein LBO69_05695 [Ignavibacteria bacterium]|jgi:hypothetical protein|nr:hypothetical protein [Ignavibacteria bacterium]